MKNISFLLLLSIALCNTSILAQEAKKSWRMVGENDSLIITPLNINSPRDDYAPIFIDGVLYFNSDRKNRHTEEAELQFNESIYTSHYQDSLWSSPQKYYFLNSDDHTSLAGYSAHDSTLFTYKTYGNGDLYKKNKRLKSPINSNWHEQSIAQYNKLIVFSSERPGGKGEHDLYWSNDSGQTVLPLDIVNTSGNEVDVSLNGNTLYFSSNGLAGLGGYDIFFSILQENGTWTTPQAMPINSKEDDRWFMDQDSMFFLSSNRADSMSSGNQDIYWGYIVPIIHKYDSTELITLMSDTLETLPSKVFEDSIANTKLQKLHSILEVIDFPIYKAHVQVGAFYYVKSTDAFKNNYSAFDTTDIRVETEQTNRGTLHRYVIDQEFLTLQEAAVRQQDAIRQQKNSEWHSGYTEAFIAVYNNEGKRILIYFNVEQGKYKILIGNQLIHF